MLLFRGMQQDAEGRPAVLPESNYGLGVRAGTHGQRGVDVPVEDGMVAPKSGGMSTFDTPERIPLHIRPVRLDGPDDTHEVFAIETDVLPEHNLEHRRVKGPHFYIEPVAHCTLAAYVMAIESTRPHWNIYV